MLHFLYKIKKEKKMSEKKQINSKELANKLGVSRSVISKVVNNYPGVSNKTRKLVIDGIKKYNYVPNLSAQSLVKKTKGDTIGFFLLSRDENFSQSPLINSMISYVAEAAERMSFHVLFYIVSNINDECSKSIKEVFSQRRVCGGIFIGFNDNEPIIEDLIKDKYPIGIYDHTVVDPCESNRFIANFNDYDVTSNAVKYLYSLGHTDIAVFKGSQKRHAGVFRFKGANDTISNLGLKIRPECVIESDFNEKAGYSSMVNFLQKNYILPSAIVALNDNVAFGVIKALKKYGYKVPEDISIIGIDGEPMGEYSDPPLTTFAFDFKEIMFNLTKKVINCILDKTDTGDSNIYTQNSVLLERHSCKKK